MHRSIRYFFAAASQAETQLIAASFAKVVQAVAQKNGEATVSFETIYSSGKTTWARAISEAVREEKDFSYDEGSVLDDTKQAWEHWHSVEEGIQVRRIDRLAIEQGSSSKMKELPEKHLDKQNIDLVEWPWPEDDCASFAYIKIAGSSESTQREMCIEIDNEIAGMPETQQFLQDAAPFIIK